VVNFGRLALPVFRCCCLAGIHFDWLLLIIGVMVTVVLLAIATLTQYSIESWVVMLRVAVTAAAFCYFKTKRGGAAAS
jgi:hypothetical protein